MDDPRKEPPSLQSKNVPDRFGRVHHAWVTIIVVVTVLGFVTAVAFSLFHKGPTKEASTNKAGAKAAVVTPPVTTETVVAKPQVVVPDSIPGHRPHNFWHFLCDTFCVDEAPVRFGSIQNQPIPYKVPVIYLDTLPAQPPDNAIKDEGCGVDDGTFAHHCRVTANAWTQPFTIKDGQSVCAFGGDNNFGIGGIQIEAGPPSSEGTRTAVLKNQMDHDLDLVMWESGSGCSFTSKPNFAN